MDKIATKEALQALAKAVKNNINSTEEVTKNCTEITYSELKALRDRGNLVPGMWYRITDYECTTIQNNTKSAYHNFDIIVLALSKNELSEEARALPHAGDTYFTEYGANLNAWKIWYCLDNNRSRFVWSLDSAIKIHDPSADEDYIYIRYPEGDTEEKYAYVCVGDTTNLDFDDVKTWNIDSNDIILSDTPIPSIGSQVSDALDPTHIYQVLETKEGKGVIYRMIDEWNNDCPYDFKNIMFLKSGEWLTENLFPEELQVTDNNTFSEIMFGGELTEDTYFYTFNWVTKNFEVQDLSIIGNSKNAQELIGSSGGCYNNSMGASSAWYWYDGDLYTIDYFAFCLPCNIFIYSEYDEADQCNDNIIHGDSWENVFAGSCAYNEVGEENANNIFISVWDSITSADSRSNVFYNTSIKSTSRIRECKIIQGGFYIYGDISNVNSKNCHDICIEGNLSDSTLIKASYIIFQNRSYNITLNGSGTSPNNNEGIENGIINNCSRISVINSEHTGSDLTAFRNFQIINVHNTGAILNINFTKGAQYTQIASYDNKGNVVINKLMDDYYVNKLFVNVTDLVNVALSSDQIHLIENAVALISSNGTSKPKIMLPNNVLDTIETQLGYSMHLSDGPVYGSINYNINGNIDSASLLCLLDDNNDVKLMEYEV